MKTRIVVDSATPAEIYNLTLAFQRTTWRPGGTARPPDCTRYDLPQQLTNEPTVTVSGSAMGWSSPALRQEHAAALLAEYEKESA